MAEKILKQNKIPGCERLTRPEEIKALSKYLRNIKETLEENTDLEETTLEVPGKTTGQLHDISELPQGKETLNHNHTIDALETERLDLEDNRIPNLSTYREGLEDKRNPTLSDYRENLEDNREVELEDYRDGLEDRRETELSDYQDKLEDKRDTVLSDFREDLEDSREPKLSDHKEIISDILEPELPGTVKELGGESRVISSLPDFKDSILDERDTTLSDYKDTLTDTRKPELSDYKYTIEDTREPELGDTRLDILDEREPTLEDTRIDISDTRDNSLSDVRIDINDQREYELSDVRLDIQDDRNPELPDTRLDLEDTRENALSDFRDDLIDERENSLSDYQESFAGEVNEVESLYDAVLGLDDPREPELSDHIENLKDDREPELSDTIIDRPANSEEDARVDGVFPNNEWNDDGSPGYYGSFDNVIPKLVDDREPELEDTIIKKDATYNPETGTFSTDGVARTDGDYDYIDNSVDYVNANPIIQLKAKNKFKAHQKVIDRPDNNEEEARIDGVFPNNEWNDDGSPGYYGSFDDVIPKLEDINEVESLYDAVLGLEDERENELSDVIIGAKENENPNSLYETLANLSEGDLYNFILQIYNEREHDSDLVIDSEWKEKIAALISTYLNPGDENKPLSPRNAHRFEDELFRSIRLIDNEEEIEGSLSRNSDGTGRIDGDYDFIDGTNTTKSQVKEHTEDDYKDIPISEMPQDSTELMIEYIRYLAEQSVGIVNNRTLRKYLLDEALWTLILTRRATEVMTGVSRDRLPGRSDTWFTALDEIYKLYQKGDLSNAALTMFSKYLRKKPNPMNRPVVNAIGIPQKTVAFEPVNSRYEANKKKGSAGVLGNLWDNILESATNLGENLAHELTGLIGYDRSYIFKNNYLRGGGIRTTLNDLCEGKTSESVEDLLEIFKNSPYITTPSKFGTIHEGSYGTQTLDSNSYWEVIIEPLCDDYLNGGYSYLPCFDEINVINYSSHGVRTAYNKWIPISNFELQKAKLTTKSVGLYDGEFSFPVSAELTNEIRFTVVDDQYKSWRNYFQKCMDVAVYNSEPHEEYYYRHEYYDGNSLSHNGKSFLDFIQNNSDYISSRVTAVDKSIITVAFYKNITFRIRIYIMTPQYSTIRRFDLLCVLKDFAEEYSGDIDSGGIDLNVTFSIVGENPNGADQDNIRNDYYTELINSGYTESQISIPEEIIDEDEWYLNSSQINLFG